MRTEYAESIGHRMGVVCRKLLRGEPRLTQWCTRRGASPRAARVLLRIATLLIVGTVLYTLIWVGIVLVGVLVVAIVMARMSSCAESIEWDLDKPSDPRDGLFYHPQDRNDDPDPRWQYPKR